MNRKHTFMQKKVVLNFKVEMYLNRVQIFRASVETFFVFLTLFRCRLVVWECCGQDAGPMLYQELHHWQVVAGSGAVKGRPTVRVLKQSCKAIMSQSIRFNKYLTHFTPDRCIARLIAFISREWLFKRRTKDSYKNGRSQLLRQLRILVSWYLVGRF